MSVPECPQVPLGAHRVSSPGSTRTELLDQSKLKARDDWRMLRVLSSPGGFQCGMR